MGSSRLISLNEELRSLDRKRFLSTRQRRRRETLLRQIEAASIVEGGVRQESGNLCEDTPERRNWICAFALLAGAGTSGHLQFNHEIE